MKKIIMCLFLMYGALCTTPLKADLEEMASVMREELNQRTAVMAGINKNVETYSVKYIVADDGSLMHIGIWANCIIGTIVANAHNVGEQVVVLLDGTIWEVSTNYKKHKDYFENKYPWGSIKSYDYKQVISPK